MLCVPLKAEIHSSRFPIVTILICILCLMVYGNQYKNEENVQRSGFYFCQTEGSQIWRMVLQKTMGAATPETCSEMMWKIRLDKDPDEKITHYAEQGADFSAFSKSDSTNYKRELIEEKYQQFERHVPRYETQQLWYEPKSWDPWHMITAAFAHGDWGHVGGNLVFFVAFAATVEIILGPLAFIVVILSLALGTHSFYSIAMLSAVEAPPTVGLSGVVMGVMGLFVFLIPTGRIRCFLWVIIFFRFIAIPAWILVGWYVGWDLFSLFIAEERSNTNFIAHISGAGIGYLLGVIFFRRQRERVRALA